MAVVSTFVYLATISEISKRTIHTVVAILTALMAETGPTRFISCLVFGFIVLELVSWDLTLFLVSFFRSSNIIIVVAIGAAGLLVGLLIEFFTRHRMLSFSTEICLNLLHRYIIKPVFMKKFAVVMKLGPHCLQVGGYKNVDS